MSFYNTNNPVPSDDPRDLDDNAKHIDELVNSTFPTFVDRKGVTRRTLAGIESDADADLLRSDLDAPSGAGIVGVSRSVVASAVTDVNMWLSLSPASPWEIPYISLVVSKPVLADPSTWDWTPALNACFAANRNVIIDTIFNLGSTVSMREGQVLVGRSNQSCGFKGNFSGFLLEYLTPNGTAERHAPQLYNLRFNCTGSSGVRLNSKTGGFTDSASSQNYMMRPVVEDCVFEGTKTGSTFGIEWNKCFNGEITRTKVQNFDFNIDFLGCDICTVSTTRSVAGGINFRALSSGTFGTGTLVIGCDLLAATVTPVVSSDRDFKLWGSYIEQGISVPCLVDITGGIHWSLKGNRIEGPAAVAPNWLRVVGEYFDIEISNNKHSGPAWGPALFNGGTGARFFANSSQRQKITVAANNNDTGVPFATLPEQLNTPMRFKSAWEMNASVRGLSSGDQGASVRVVNGAFVLPYSPTAQYSFFDVDKVITGNVNIYIKASASVNGLLLTCQRRNGTTPISGASQALTTTPTWYQIHGVGPAVVDLHEYFLNTDAAANGEAYIHALTVDYV